MAKIYRVIHTKLNQCKKMSMWSLTYQQTAPKRWQWQTLLRAFTYKMAAKIDWHRSGTKLRHSHPIYNEPMMMMTMMIVFRGLITVTVKISSFFVGENGWRCSRPVWRPSTDFVLPSVWPLVYKHAVNYTSVRRNDLTPLLRFVVDLLCNLFIQLVQHLTRFRLISRPAVHLCTNVWQKKTLVSLFSF